MITKKRLMIIIPIAVVFIIVFATIIGFVLTKKDPNTKKENTTKYNLDLNINFQENIMFSKYNVKMKLEGKEVLLNHGEQKSFSYSLAKGTYTIYFEKDEDDNIKNKYQFTIEEDTHLGLLVKSKMDTIEVSKEYQYNDSDVSVEELVIDFTNSELVDKNYKKVMNELYEKGFTNIKTKAVYDIEFGITPEKSIKKVTIDGNTEYKKGDKVVKDVKVVIHYHMSADKNPKNKESSTSTEKETKETTQETTVSKGYFHSSNDINVAKQGTTGTYAYVNKGKEMDSYIVIDMDNKVVYNFQERNQDNTGIKTSNISGDLKNGLSVTWIFPDSSGTEKMKFSYSTPDVLSFTDNDGFSYTFEGANYTKTKEYMNNHSFTNY